jgi:hypothetical protein
VTFTFGRPVTVLRDTPGGFDPYGDPVTSTTIRTLIEACAIAPRYSTEPTERGRQGVIVGLSVYAPAGSDITSTDRLEIDGITYVIDGEPAEWVNPFTGSWPGLEVAVRRATG